MDPATVSLILGMLIKYGPDAYLAVRKLLAKTAPTEEDFAELDAILMKSGASYFDPKR